MLFLLINYYYRVRNPLSLPFSNPELNSLVGSIFSSINYFKKLLIKKRRFSYYLIKTIDLLLNKYIAAVSYFFTNENSCSYCKSAKRKKDPKIVNKEARSQANLMQFLDFPLNKFISLK